MILAISIPMAMILNNDYKDNKSTLKYFRIEFEKIHNSSLKDFSIVRNNNYLYKRSS